MHEDMRHRILAWKTQMWEKPRQRTGCRKYHYMRGIQCRRKNTEATTSCPLLSRHTRRLQRGGNNLSLSLSLSRSIQLLYTIMQQHVQNLCPKSYLYMYDFSAYLHLCPSNRSVPIGAGSVRSRFSASSIRFHPEGHVSQHPVWGSGNMTQKTYTF